MNCFKNDFEHVPLKVSKLCHYYICHGHGGEISEVVEDNRHRRSHIPSRGIEVKLRLSFKSSGEIVYKIKQLIREDLNV